MKFITAKCPNCNGELNIPPNKEVFKCEYCGVSIILSSLDEYKKIPNAIKYLKLANTYFEIKDYKEALKYFEKVLEFEPTNSYAWIGKAKTLYKLSNRLEDNIPEIVGCLKKAKEFSHSIENSQIKNEIISTVNEVMMNHHNQNLLTGDNIQYFSIYYRTPFVLCQMFFI